MLCLSVVVTKNVTCTIVEPDECVSLLGRGIAWCVMEAIPIRYDTSSSSRALLVHVFTEETAIHCRVGPCICWAPHHQLKLNRYEIFSATPPQKE